MTAELFTRDEVLTGLPARRAWTLLFLIESKSAHLMAQSRQAMEIFLTEETTAERELAFLEAFSLGKQPPLQPSIQDIERFAPQWASLIPDEPRLRATLVHVLSERYRFTHASVPNIRSTLGLDEEPVRKAYEQLYHQPLDNIYAARQTPIASLRWMVAHLANRLESLPPFWTAFSLTLTETVGAGTLALPIAVAGVGPLGGVIVLVVLGIVNVLTIASISESVARSGTIRYGNAFVGKMVTDYLGNAGSITLTLGAAATAAAGLLAYYIGFSSTLASASGIPSLVWAVLLFLVGLYFLTRQSINATVASALIVGAVNISVILGLALIAFLHARPDYLFYINWPFLNGRPFEPAILGLIFGNILSAYVGHLSVANCAKVVLRRDPSARSLIWGGMAAQLAALILYSIWVLAVNGAVAPEILAAHPGTALTPLAAQIGPLIYVLGIVYVILAMGMASIHVSLSLSYMVRERLPSKTPPVISMPRYRGKLILKPRRSDAGNPRLGLTYLGIENGTQFRLDVQTQNITRRFNLNFTRTWDISELSQALSKFGVQDFSLALEALRATPESVQLRIISSMRITYEGEWVTSGLELADILLLSEERRKLVNWMLRQQEVTLDQATAYLDRGEESTQMLLEELLSRGLLEKISGSDGPVYKVRLAHRKGRQLPMEIWQSLGGEAQTTTSEKSAVPHQSRIVTQSIWDALSGKYGRFLLSISPVVAIFILCEWLFLNQSESFAGPLGLAGVLAGSLLAGIFPVLLLLSSRKKGEFVPGVVYRVLGSPIVAAMIYLLFLSGIFAHGLFIWQDTFRRSLAILVGFLILAVTVIVFRKGAFVPRAIVEIKKDQTSGEAHFSITQAGRAMRTAFQVGYPGRTETGESSDGAIPNFEQARYLNLSLPRGQARQLKVWAYELNPEGVASGMPAMLEVRQKERRSEYDLLLTDGQMLLPLVDQTCDLTINFSGEQI